jgi:alpha-amylase/alpha-mannosidase (GH57 family)
MPRTLLAFVWHMHQPFYKDLASGEYQLPWTRMHALKDYYGMVQMLEEFPQVRQTFNLVPSMIAQIEEYARGDAQDPFLRCALKPADTLTPDDQAFILKYFFQANAGRLIYRYPRYGELFDAWRAADQNAERARRSFTPAAMRDLQVLSQLAWFDEIVLESDPAVKALVEKGRDYSPADQALMGRKQIEICSMVMPAYSKLAKRGQVELSVTPFYHPILPLLCDSNIASISHPNVALPRQFRYPEDARYQIQTALDFAEQRLGARPAGMWPSEGSVSDEVFRIASECGVRWMATDNGVLGATLGRVAGVDETYRPWVWTQGGRSMQLIFRDHFLSDLIGFVYSRMEPVDAASHFLDRVRENARSLHAQGRDALVPVILDGENAWEHYELNGRPFLKELYRQISDDPSLEAVTVSEALRRVPAGELTRVHPGSWINANYDIWIGASEDNHGWECLLDARALWEKFSASAEARTLDPERLRMAYEELLIAEGSDWFWWYGPEHSSENRPEFDKLFREHLANFYRLIGKTPPDELSRPILEMRVIEYHEPPTGMITPVIDGEVSSYFEWMGAGHYRPDERQGSMHGRKINLQEVQYGSDGASLFVRVDFHLSQAGAMAGMEIRCCMQALGDAPGNKGGPETEYRLQLARDGVEVIGARGPGAKAPGALKAAYRRVLEIAVPLASLGGGPHSPVRFQLSLWEDGLPLDAQPAQGWIQFIPSELDG